MSAKSLTQPAALLYDEDFALWTAETARLLRQGRFTELDVEHLAEEVEDMGKSQHRELGSRLAVIIQHLLKWQLQRERRSGSWKATIVTQRAELDRLFEQSPSVRRGLRASVPRVYPGAVAAAAAETDLPVESFPRECPFAPEQILDQDFFPSS
jgi:hypothetical protein